MRCGGGNGLAGAFPRSAQLLHVAPAPPSYLSVRCSVLILPARRYTSLFHSPFCRLAWRRLNTALRSTTGSDLTVTHHTQVHHASTSASSTAAAPTAVSSSEAAFQAAMFGDYLSPPQPSTAEAPPAANSSLSASLSSDAPSAERKPSHPFSATKKEATALSAEESGAGVQTAAQSSPTSAADNAVGEEGYTGMKPLPPPDVTHALQKEEEEEVRQQAKAQPLESAAHLSAEEAFERALYSDLFGASPFGGESTENSASANEELEKEAEEAEMVLAEKEEKEDGKKRRDTPATPPPAPSHLSSRTITDAEAAFERALLGAVTTEAGEEEEEGKGVSTNTGASQSESEESESMAALAQEDASQLLTDANSGDASASLLASKEEFVGTDEHSDSAPARDTARNESHLSQEESAVEEEEEAGLERMEDALFETDDHPLDGGPPSAAAPLHAAPPENAEEDVEAAEAAATRRRVGRPPKEVAEREALELRLLPPPPPTVSTTCTFNLSTYDDPLSQADGQALRDALFGLTDCKTGVETLVDPVDRVEDNMPLLDRATKLTVFYDSGWLLQLQEPEAASLPLTAPSESTASHQEGTNAETAAEAEKSSAGLTSTPTHREVVGRSKVLRCLLFRLLRSPHLWWDQVEELIGLAVRTAQEEAKSRELAPPVGVDGKSDDGGDGVAAADGVAHREEELLCAALTPDTVRAAMKRVFGSGPHTVHFHSLALRRELRQMYTSSLSSAALSSSGDESSAADVFTGPAATWKAYVLTHRRDATRVCGPHVRPFSYGEFRPTITAAELTPLQYCDAEASWCAQLSAAAPATFSPPSNAASYAVDAVASTANAGTGASAAAAAAAGQSAPTPAAAQPWETMNEVEQNAFLFGNDSAQFSARLRSADGIFFVYGEGGVSFEEEDKYAAAEEALQQSLKAEEEGAEGQGGEGADSAGDADGGVPASQISPLQRAQAEELARLRPYDVDRVVLELMDAEGRHEEARGASSALLSSSAAPYTASSVTGGPSASSSSLAAHGGGRGVRSSPRQSRATTPFQLQLRNKEDVQLAALWQRFTNASTGELLDNLLHVQRHPREALVEAAAELVVQKAFWLLFFARDEVRAFVDPRRTHETVWRLHRQLLGMLCPPSCSAGGSALRGASGDGVAASAASGVRRDRPFEGLTALSQVSYACFGCTHIPARRAGVSVAKGSPSEAPRYDTAAALYDSLQAVTKDGGGSVGEEQEVEMDIDDVVAENPYDFSALSPLQQLAVEFCFPRSDAEQAEMALLRLRDRPPVGSCSVLQAAGDGDARRPSQEAAIPSELVSLPAAPLAVRTHSGRADRVALWVNHARAVLCADAAERERLLSAPLHLRRGRPPLRSASPSAPTEEKTEAADVAADAALVEGGEGHRDDDDDTSAVSATQDAAMEANAEKEEEEAALRRRAEAAQHAREAVEASLYRCLCALHVTGILPLTQRREERAASAPLLTAPQHAAVQQAVEMVLASLAQPSSSKGGTNPAGDDVPLALVADPVREQEKASDDDATSSSAEEEESPAQPPQEKQGNASRVRGGGRKGRRAAAAEAASSRQPPASVRHGHRREEAAAVATDAVGRAGSAGSDPPIGVRKRGRPRRVPNADGTYTKQKYVHRAAYLAKKGT